MPHGTVFGCLIPGIPGSGDYVMCLIPLGCLTLSLEINIDRCTITFFEWLSFVKTLLVSLWFLHSSNVIKPLYYPLKVWSHRRRITKRKQTDKNLRVKNILFGLSLRNVVKHFAFTSGVTTKMVEMITNRIDGIVVVISLCKR